MRVVEQGLVVCESVRANREAVDGNTPKDFRAIVGCYDLCVESGPFGQKLIFWDVNFSKVNEAAIKVVGGTGVAERDARVGYAALIVQCRDERRRLVQTGYGWPEPDYGAVKEVLLYAVEREKVDIGGTRGLVCCKANRVRRHETVKGIPHLAHLGYRAVICVRVVRGGLRRDEV